MKIALMPSDRQGLMQRLDLDRDGKITELELYRVLLGADSNHNSESIAVTQAIKKIAAGAAAFASMGEYVKDLVRKFDRNSDGYLSI
jgi:Ca2+-binding EF-hand superfamily protein